MSVRTLASLILPSSTPPSLSLSPSLFQVPPLSLSKFRALHSFSFHQFLRTLTLNPISTPPHSRSLDFAASINGLSGSSLHQFPLTRFSLPSSSSSNYLNGWISTPLPDRDREPRGVEARAAESCAGEEEDAKASGLSKTLELGSLFGLWFLFNIYFNIYNKQVDDCSLSSLPLPWKRRTQDHHSKLPSIAHHNLHFYLLILGFSFDVNIGLQWNFRSLEGIWMGRKRGREKEKKTPIFLGIASDFALYVAESPGFYVFPPLRKNTDDDDEIEDEVLGSENDD
ncbi:hypothetical protein RHMOL_Rhmol12G0104200 [Rhododendron molle]|uniref:Uncharacterized protein n=1 Tax=Rhododendron molle TaxID=49168 RepID=A0ACC0LHS8_RHOML|nr:hypothetical protein RHMOL_Rhmol12G0104200 [Rhododendron molle]